MSVLFEVEFSGLTGAQLDAADPNPKVPPGLILHTVLPTESGVRILDLWESREAADAFYNAALNSPAAAAFPRPELKVFEVHRYVKG